MSDEQDSKQLRHPELPEDHPLNVIDPDSDVPPVLQVERHLGSKTDRRKR